MLASFGMAATVVAFALIASAESLFSAAAVDRLHDGPRTEYDKELIAQGAGNAVCGVLGALPMTAVIVRSSANVAAGARTKLSRVLHGVWLLLFAAALPGGARGDSGGGAGGCADARGLEADPAARLVPLWREHRAEAVVLGVTAAAIFVVNMFEGVLIGLLLAVVKTAWEISHVQVETEDAGAACRCASGCWATPPSCGCPSCWTSWRRCPPDRRVELSLAGLRHMDHACGMALSAWEEEHNARAGAAAPSPSSQQPPSIRRGRGGLRGDVRPGTERDRRRTARRRPGQSASCSAFRSVASFCWMALIACRAAASSSMFRRCNSTLSSSSCAYL